MSKSITFGSFCEAMEEAFTKPEHFDDGMLNEYYAIFKDPETNYPAELGPWIEFMFCGWDELKGHDTMLISQTKTKKKT